MLLRFWQETNWLSRLALLCAMFGAFANTASYAGASFQERLQFLAFNHVLILLLGVVLVARIFWHNWLEIRTRHQPEVTSRTPKSLRWATGLALAYALTLFLGLFAVYGEGRPEMQNGQEVWVRDDKIVRVLPRGSVAHFDVLQLRIFSAAWLFFGLMIAVVAHRYEERIRGYAKIRPSAAA